MKWPWSKVNYYAELFQDMGGSWRFRIKHCNGNILASSEAYSSRSQAHDTASQLAYDAGWQLKVLADRDKVHG